MMYPARIPPIEAQAKLKRVVTTNQGQITGPAGKWEMGTKYAYLMPPPHTPNRDLTREREEEGEGGAY